MGGKDLNLKENLELFCVSYGEILFEIKIYYLEYFFILKF